MERKLIRQGVNGCTIYLPRKWIEKRGLEPGDGVEVSELDNKVVISAKKELKVSRGEVNLAKLSPIQFRAIIALYRKGCDEIIVKYDDPKAPEQLRRVVAEMIGFEIISQGRAECTLKEISKPSDEEFENVLRRIFYLVKTMSAELHSALKEGADLSPIIDMDTSINKFSYYCSRLLNKNQHFELKKTNSIYHIVNELENLGDAYRDLARSVKGKPSAELLSNLQTANSLFSEYQELFFSFSSEKATSFAKEWDKARSSLEKSRDKAAAASLLQIIFTITRMFEEQLTYEV